MKKNLIWIEINKSNLIHNLRLIRNVVGDKVLLAPCVKANAYGHGILGVSKILIKNGADYLCVNSIEEASYLRNHFKRIQIIVMGYIEESQLEKIISLNLEPFICDLKQIKKIDNLARKNRKIAKIHLKVDTGMSRQGILSIEAEKIIKKIYPLKNVKLQGVATHFATSDGEKNNPLFEEQFTKFTKLRGAVQMHNHALPKFHCANSAATLVYPHTHLDMVRPGLSVYGYYPSKEIEKLCHKIDIYLKPTLTLKTRINYIKTLPKETCVSYGCTYQTKKKRKVAVLPIGYSDGVDRKLSNNGYVIIRNKKAPIIGRVCMNLTMVDVTNIPYVRAKDEVTVIGTDKHKEISVDTVAKNIETINYEITTRLRESLPRIYR